MSAWFRIPLWQRVMLGLALGSAIGLALRYSIGADAASEIATTWFKPFGDAFVNLIRMLVVPLIFTTLVAGVTAMGDPSRLGALGGRAIITYMITTWFAVALGLLIGSIVQPGAGFDVGSIPASELETARERLGANDANQGLIDRLVAIIPTNPVAAMANGDVLQIIFFAILVGLGCLLARDAGRPLAQTVESGADVMMRITHIVMEAAPIGVLALMTWVMATQGLGVFVILGKMVLALYVACLLHILITYGFLIKVVARLPFVRFIRGILDAQAVAFSTSSSNATLPVTMACVRDNLGVSRTVSSSVLPLGATINMDGTALYQGLIALFAAQAFGIEMTPAMYGLVMLTATLVSIGTAGIPSVSLFLAATTLSVIGATPEQTVIVIAVLFPFDRLLDMMRTVTNITGDAAVAVVVAKWEGEIDEDVFRAPATT
ncbi:cation:dicarboxylase symporter family transporter [bacterium]|nr:cation:dicarboxylase symporter family transporter [bacterium]